MCGQGRPPRWPQSRMKVRLELLPIAWRAKTLEPTPVTSATRPIAWNSTSTQETLTHAKTIFSSEMARTRSITSPADRRRSFLLSRELQAARRNGGVSETGKLIHKR